jgi:hypothetical protein
MLYALVIIMFLATCIIAIGYAGRGPSDEHQPRGKKP